VYALILFFHFLRKRVCKRSRNVNNKCCVVVTAVEQSLQPGDNAWWQSCVRKARASCAQSFALWQQATIEITRRDHSPRALVITFNRSQVDIGRASTQRLLLVRASHI